MTYLWGIFSDDGEFHYDLLIELHADKQEAEAAFSTYPKAESRYYYIQAVPLPLLASNKMCRDLDERPTHEGYPIYEIGG